ncbi:hypothetical protein H6S82_20895 [Planktothrix sp. FACHB-1355]|uniref:Uncharacterized protein n=1 Tax=Aerosakkonema funiforme FACHB-1375 TaxID=2949571 RepID=A0A926ZIQ7_9CYAN|nr:MULTISPECIES: hypothetical protein [Oscillatoriales]MBD2183547.1 hypothetical protein [Aerosakkonema funiforme FACHB-1375]MBD3561279.1 hypothetical protein [Planktothrix sp. FACHB-1355]
MNEVLNDPLVQSFISSFFAGEINLATGIVWLGIAIGFSILGGAIGGILLAGKDLGYRLAAMIGGLFGPAAIIPATVLGLIVIAIN